MSISAIFNLPAQTSVILDWLFKNKLYLCVYVCVFPLSINIKWDSSHVTIISELIPGCYNLLEPKLEGQIVWWRQLTCSTT